MIITYITNLLSYLQYGRSGRAKPKIVKYNTTTQCIEWAGRGNESVNKVLRALFRRRSSGGGLLGGGDSSKDGAGGGGGEDDGGAASIQLSSIREVCNGVQTEVLRKAGLVDPGCCLSIVTDARSVDIILANSTERDRIVKGLQLILAGRNVVFSV